MPENYIMINNVKILLTDEQIKQFNEIGKNTTSTNYVDMQNSEAKNKTKSPFYRAEKHSNYFLIDNDDRAIDILEEKDEYDDKRFEIANYFNNENFAQLMAWRQRLNRLLWRYSYEHDWNDDLWNSMKDGKYTIIYDHHRNDFVVDESRAIQSSGCYFASFTAAHNAIHEVIVPFMKEHPDFKW